MFRVSQTLIVPTVALLAFLVAPRSAEACSCIPPRVKVSPTAREVAPRNTRVRLSVPANYGWVPSDAVSAADVAVRLRAGDAEIAFDRIDYSMGDIHFIELRPKAPLAPGTRHGVYAQPPGEKEELVGEFRTGNRIDTTPPSWSGVLRAVYYHMPAVCCNCSTGNPHAVLTLSEVRDEGPPENALAYGVWLADSRGQIDYARPPYTIGRDWKRSLTLGHFSSCSPANFRFPPGARTIKLGVRALDLAGNASAPSELVLDLTNPVRTEPGRK